MCFSGISGNAAARKVPSGPPLKRRTVALFRAHHKKQFPRHNRIAGFLQKKSFCDEDTDGVCEMSPSVGYTATVLPSEGFVFPTPRPSAAQPPHFVRQPAMSTSPVL